MTARVPQRKEPCTLPELRRKALGAEGKSHRIPAIRRKSHPEALDARGIKAAPCKVRSCRGTFGRSQRSAVKALRHLVRLGETRGLITLSRLLLGNLHAALACEPPHGLGESEVVMADQEAENIAPHTAAKAVKDLAIGADVERRGLLGMEGAQAFVVATGGL